MKTIELTDVEAHLISEVFEATAYPGPLEQAIQEVAHSCGVIEEVGSSGLQNLLETIFEKTK